MSQSLVFLPRFSSFSFFLNKLSSDGCKPLASLQSSQKVDFDNFASIVTALMEGWTDAGSDSAILESCLPPSR